MSQPTRALILAAGIGRRLSGGDPTPHPPKALLRFADRSLIARHLDLLHRSDVTDVTIVLGYGEALMREELNALPGPKVSVVVNPDYRLGSVVSLYAGREVLRTGAPVILMDADVIYDIRLMRRLVESPLPNTLLLDREIEPGDEPVKLCIRNGQIVDFHKRPTMPHDWHGESVGFFRFHPDTAADLATRTEQYVRSGRGGMEYEEPIRDMMMAAPPGRFGFQDISGLPWTEIDFPEDVEKANALLPELAP